ncbi:hypothetical protein V2J09_006973 [Rumex salicifolius]
MPRSQAFKFCFSFKPMFNLRASESPEDVMKLFDEYSENGTMSVHHLHKFLVEQQGERDATEEDAQAIFNGLKHLQIFQRKGATAGHGSSIVTLLLVHRPQFLLNRKSAEQ